MPLGLLSDVEFEEELASLNRRPTLGEVKERNVGRGNSTNIDPSVRALIAETAIEGESTSKEVAEAFGVSPHSVTAYKNGATSLATYNDPDIELRKATNRKRAEISDLAHQRVLDALKTITPAKLSDASAKVASAIARDVSAVVKNITPQNEEAKSVQFIVFAPQMKSDEDFLPAIRVE